MHTKSDVVDTRLDSKDSFDEIPRLRETIDRVKEPPEGETIPMIIVGSEFPVQYKGLTDGRQGGLGRRERSGRGCG